MRRRPAPTGRVIWIVEVLALAAAGWVLCAALFFRHHNSITTTTAPQQTAAFEPQQQDALPTTTTTTTPPRVSLRVDWAEFLGRADMVWRWESRGAAPALWHESALLGNGRIGAMVGIDVQRNSLRVELGRTDVYDDRAPGSAHATGNFALDRPRLPIGRFFVPLLQQNAADAGEMRLRLWDAEARGTIGELSFEAFVSAVQDAVVVKLRGTKRPKAKFEAADAQSSWGVRDDWRGNATYVKNPSAQCEAPFQGRGSCTQPLLSGSSYTTAWRVVEDADPRCITLIATVSSVCKESRDEALATLDAVTGDYDALATPHRKWWHSYYTDGGFLTLDASKVESFYWIQMYKLASSTREDKEIFDLQGPWTVEGSFWPDLHHDLNLQLTYWPVYASNRLHLGKSLTRWLDSHIKEFTENVPPEWRKDSAAAPATGSALDGLASCYWNEELAENCLVLPPSITGNLLWETHNYFMQASFSNDPKLLQSLFPLLRRAVQFYQHFQISKPDGSIHLPPTFSPEYTFARGPDTNYDLALYRWGLQRIIWLAEKLAIADPLVPTWRDTLKRLAPFSTHPVRGFEIAAGVPLNNSHRHFSHLFMVHPLSGLTNFSSQDEVSLAARSVDWWAQWPKLFQGYSLSELSTMSTLLGRPGAAWGNLTKLINGRVLANTLYCETKECWPCGETPLAAASALQDMLFFSSENGTTSIFPGVGRANIEDIGEAAFWHFRAHGGLVYSAKYSAIDACTEFVEIANEFSTPIRATLVHRLCAPLHVLPSATRITTLDDTTVALDVPPHANVLLFGSTNPASFVVGAAQGQLGQFNAWGKH